MKLHFVTSNQNKLREAEQILGMPLACSNIDLVEIQDRDVATIAKHKAKEAWNVVKEPVFVWDGGVYIDCLNGFPGPFIKWFWEQVTLDKMCQIARCFNNNKIATDIALAYYDGKDVKIFTARIEGTIPPIPRGEMGWGWDAIFIPAGSTKTYAEMDEEEVLQFRTHRIALERLRDYLRSI